MTDHPPPSRTDGPLLEVTDLTVSFPGRRRGAVVQAVAGVSFTVAAGETLGLVGESGCGKSSVARAVLQLPPPTAGRVRFAGRELTALGRRELRALRGRMQLVFQDPVSSLNPRRSVRDIVAEPLAIAGAGGDHRARADELLATVGIDPALGGQRPDRFSGGQCQRIGVARALATDPQLLLCDEPVSALDVSVQAQVLNLLEELKAQRGLTMVFISHDLSVVRNISDRVAVMHLGKLCEIGATDALYRRPAHPYTRALLDAAPATAGRRAPGAPPAPLLRGELPSPSAPPSGCRFRTRCPRVQPRCAQEEPVLAPVPAPPGCDAVAHEVACHFPLLAGERSADPPAGA